MGIQGGASNTSDKMYHYRNNGEPLIDLNRLFRGEQGVEAKGTGLMSGNILVLGEHLSQMMGEDEIRCKQFIEDGDICVQHSLAEMLLRCADGCLPRCVQQNRRSQQKNGVAMCGNEINRQVGARPLDPVSATLTTPLARPRSDPSRPVLLA